MRKSFLQALKPLCPVCGESSVQLWLELHGDGDVVREGVLMCSECGSEYPIIDGIPMLVPSLRKVVRDSLFQIVERDDLSPTLRSLLGDCCGADGAWGLTRQHASSYCWDHWADFDPNEVDLPAPGSITRMAQVARTGLGELEEGAILDLGCSVGRASVELSKGQSMVLGVDMNMNLLRHAQRVLMRGRCSYPRRRNGLVYERRDFPVDADLSRVDFWCCDVRALPFADGTFVASAALNLVDSVSDPEAMLTEALRVSSGPLAVSSPFDWSEDTTPPEKWLGGHSQRGGRPDPVEALRHWLKEHDRPIRAEQEVPWALRLHDRSALHYRSWLGIA